jgi:hypothetical protein
VSRDGKKAPAGPNVSGTVKKLLGGRDIPLPPGALGRELGRMLAEIAVELQDKIDAARFWQVRFEALKGEIKCLAAVIMSKQAEKRIVITRKELDALPDDIEVHIEAPEEGVRIYTLRKKPTKVGNDVRRILNG